MSDLKDYSIDDLREELGLRVPTMLLVGLDGADFFVQYNGPSSALLGLIQYAKISIEKSTGTAE